MSMNALKTRLRRWQARRRFDRRPRCRTCNNLDYKGHQETDSEGNKLELKIKFPELTRDCPFCGLVILSIESVVGKDCWNARIIDPEDGKEMGTIVTLYLEKGKPITGRLLFWYANSSHTRLNADNIVSQNDGTRIVQVRFVIYSMDEVSSSPHHPNHAGT